LGPWDHAPRTEDRMHPITSQTTLPAALMAGVFVLFGIALFQSDVLPEPPVPVPVRLRTWLRRADIVFKPVAFLGALLATGACGYDLEHDRVYPGDIHLAESIVAVLAVAVLVRAVARNVLESLWRPASAPHLAPILREEEVDWLWIAGGILGDPVSPSRCGTEVRRWSSSDGHNVPGARETRSPTTTQAACQLRQSP
jgi:hypothetical protein